MSKKEKDIEEEVEELKRIAIFLNNFSHSQSVAPHVFIQDITSWMNGQIIRDETQIKFLLSINAPVEIWYKNNANRQPKG